MKLVSKTRVIAICAIVFAFGAGNSAMAGGQPIRIGTEGTWKPFSYQDAAGNLTGFEVELVRDVCAKAAASCELVVIPFDNLIPSLQEGKIDAVASGLRITEKRKKVVDFATPYYRLPPTFVTCRHTDLKDNAVETLKGLSVGVQVATASADFLKLRYGELDIRTYKNIDEMYADLASGRLDLAFGNKPTAYDFLNGEKGKSCGYVGDTVTDPEFFKEPNAIAVRKDDAATRETLNKGIAKVLSDGSFETLNAKYWPFSIKEGAAAN